METLFDWPNWADKLLMLVLLIACFIYVMIEIYEMIKSHPK